MRDLTKTGRYISNRIGRAIADYNLIEHGDRILVAVSGGKDSLALLRLLNERRRWAPIDYSLTAAHIVTDYRCSACVHSEVLKDYFDDHGIESHFEKIKILDSKRRSSPSCFWCAWNRRKALFQLAGRLNIRKIAFGHHMDDITETLLLNIFYHGEFSAMNPVQELFGGRIVIIRPLCYVEEDALRRFAKEENFPSQLCRCPNSELSKRRAMKNIIRDIEKDCRYVKTNIYRSMARIKADYIGICEEESAVGSSASGRLPTQLDA
jgi:tRNA 2-thiocytidine biosynthesis protein TtcA